MFNTDIWSIMKRRVFSQLLINQSWLDFACANVAVQKNIWKNMYFVCKNFEFAHFQYIFNFAKRILFSSDHQDLMKFHCMIRYTHSAINKKSWWKILSSYMNEFTQQWTERFNEDFIIIKLIKLFSTVE